MSYSFILGQILSALAVFFSIVAIFGKDKKNMVAIMLLSDSLYALAYLVLGGYSGFTSAAVLIIRHILDLKGKLNKYNTSAICVVIIFLGILFNENSYLGILPITASVSFVILAYLAKSTQNMRIAIILGFSQWAIFDFYIKAYPLFAMEVITFLTSIFAYIKNINKSEEVLNEVYAINTPRP